MSKDANDTDTALMGGQPHGWIQWKGTDVSIDLYCACGAHLYFEGDFMYFWACPHCKRHYQSGSHVRMYELTSEEITERKAQGCEFDNPVPDENFPKVNQ